MASTFADAKRRDMLRDRLAALAEYMQRSFDQGADGRIAVTDEMIGDIRTAAVVVGSADTVAERPKSFMDKHGFEICSKCLVEIKGGYCDCPERTNA